MVGLDWGEEMRSDWSREQAEQHKTSHLRLCKWEGGTRWMGWFCTCVNRDVAWFVPSL